MQIHTIKGYIQNIFLVEYEHALLLLDGCGRADVDSVCEFITQELQRNLSDLALIVVTHMHPDHAGGAHRLRELSGAPIACHPNAPGWYKGIMGRTAHFIDIVLLQYVAHRLKRKKRRGWYPAVLEPDIILTDEQPLPGFEDWQVLYTPGHTNHDLSIYHKNTHQIYVADLIVWVKGRLHPPYPVCHPNQYRRSLNRVGGLDHPSVMFAHVGTRCLSDQDINDVIELAPSRPSNHYHATKARISRVLKRAS